MEPNNQPQQQAVTNSSLPSVTPIPSPTPISEPVVPIISAAELFSVMATPPSKEAEEVRAPIVVAPAASTEVVAVPQVPLLEQVELLEKDIILLDQKRESLEVETGALASEQKQIEDSLAPVVKAEADLRKVLKEIEAREMSAKTKEERRKAEQERWEQEQKRRTVEVEKLEIKGRIEKILSSITGKEILHQSIVDEEAAIRKKIHGLEVEQKRVELNVKLQLITQTRGDAELKLADITKEKARIEQLLRDTQEKEKAIEGNEHDTEQKMTIAQTFKEECALAEARAALEKERHDIEAARWEAEDQAEALGLSADDAAASLKEIKKQEAEVVAAIKAFK